MELKEVKQLISNNSSKLVLINLQQTTLNDLQTLFNRVEQGQDTVQEVETTQNNINIITLENK